MDNIHYSSIYTSITHCRVYTNPKLVDGVLHYDTGICPVSVDSQMVHVEGHGSFNIKHADFEHNTRTYNFPYQNTKLQFLGLTVL